MSLVLVGLAGATCNMTSPPNLAQVGKDVFEYLTNVSIHWKFQLNLLKLLDETLTRDDSKAVEGARYFRMNEENRSGITPIFAGL